MSGAIIVIDQPAGAGAGSPGVARNDLWQSRQANLSVGTGGNSNYQWDLLDVPPGSAAALTGPTTATPHFTPDVLGTYRIQLITNGGGPGNVQILIARVRYSSTGVLQNRGWAPPAFGERAGEANYGGNVRGWSEHIEFILADIGDTLDAGGGGSGGGTPDPEPDTTVKRDSGGGAGFTSVDTPVIHGTTGVHSTRDEKVGEGATSPGTPTVTLVSVTVPGDAAVSAYVEVNGVDRSSGDTCFVARRVTLQTKGSPPYTPTVTVLGDDEFNGTTTGASVAFSAPSAALAVAATTAPTRTIDWSYWISITQRIKGGP